jgi:hypothetical protein
MHIYDYGRINVMAFIFRALMNVGVIILSEVCFAFIWVHVVGAILFNAMVAGRLVEPMIS